MCFLEFFIINLYFVVLGQFLITFSSHRFYLFIELLLGWLYLFFQFLDLSLFLSVLVLCLLVLHGKHHNFLLSFLQFACELNLDLLSLVVSILDVLTHFTHFGFILPFDFLDFSDFQFNPVWQGLFLFE